MQGLAGAAPCAISALDDGTVEGLHGWVVAQSVVAWVEGDSCGGDGEGAGPVREGLEETSQVVPGRLA